MKKRMNGMGKRMKVWKGLLTVCCIFTVALCISFVSHAVSTGTVRNDGVNVRSQASTTASTVTTLAINSTVTITEEVNGTDGYVWYKVTTSNGIIGFIRSDLVTKSTEGDTTTNNNTTTNVTDVDDKTAYISGSNANIRQEASTSSGRVANARGGSEVTIVGETTGTDGYKWYKIEFVGNGNTMTGFIRSDLVTFEEPTQDPEVTEITGEMGEGNSEEPESPEEPDNSEIPDTSEVPPVEEETTIPVTANIDDLQILEPNSALEILPQGFEQTELQLGDNVYTVWGKDNFYIMYASVNDGTPQYYLYDAQNKGYVAYTGLLTNADVAVSEEEAGLNYQLIAIICIVVIVIMAMVVGILAYKLANSRYDYDDEDYDDDDDDEDDDDEDDDDEDEDDDMFIELSLDGEMPKKSSSVASVIVPQAEGATEEDVVETEGQETIPQDTTTVAGSIWEEVEAETASNQQQASEETVASDDVNTFSIDLPENAVSERYVDASEPVYEELSYETESSEEEDELSYEEDEEEVVESRKDKKKKEKKKFGRRFLDYFTVEEEDDDEEYDEDDDDEDYTDEEDDDDDNVSPTGNSDKKSFDSDDDDLDFIDL